MINIISFAKRKYFYVFFCAYLLINLLFVVKYGSRQNIINIYLLSLVYLIACTLVLFLAKTVNLSYKFYKNSFFILSTLFFLLTIIINILVDGNGLNVDRWSAMDVAIHALINNEYPYSAIDHLNGRTSNLPSLIFLGMPFYFMGDVGYLQSFTFLLFIYLLYISFDSYKTRLIGLFYLICSASYFWEIYVKSDLMSNMIIVLLFAVVIKRKLNDNGINIVLVSILSALLLLTRLIVFIPLSLLLFQLFYYSNFRDKVRFLAFAVGTVFLSLFIVFRKYGTVENLLQFNPVDLQNRQLPFVVSMICMLFPIGFSLMIHSIKSLVIYSILFLSIPVVLAFLFNISSNGFNGSLFKSGFDISYFNIIQPFLIYALVSYCDNNE